jgi:hypothetical protein
VALAHGRLRTLRGEPVAADVPVAARPLVEALRTGVLVDASEFPARQASRLAGVLERHRR